MLQSSYLIHHGSSASGADAAGPISFSEHASRIGRAEEKHKFAQELLVKAHASIAAKLQAIVAPLIAINSAAINMSKYSLLTSVNAAKVVDATAVSATTLPSTMSLETPATVLQAYNNDLRAAHGAISRGGRPSAQASRVSLLMAEALSAWHSGEYGKAREKYAEVIQRFQDAGAGPRLGIALCLYKLGHIDAAKKACKRALQLDGTCTQALGLLSYLESNGSALAIAAGTLDPTAVDQNAQAEAAKRGAALAKRAVQQSSSCGQALLELAHHAFDSWVDIVSPATGQPVTVTATRGSKHLVLSDASMALASRFRTGETIKVLAMTKEGPKLVPFRVSREKAEVTRLSALPFTLPSMPAGLSQDSQVVVLHVRQPWGLGNATGLTLKALDLDSAVQLARQAAASATSTGGRMDAQYALGKALHARGDLVDAGVAYRNCLKFDGKHAAALTGLAQVEASRGSPGEDEAVKLLTRVLEIHSEDRTALKLLAAIRLRQKRLDEALDYAKRASELAPWDSGAAALFCTLAMRSEGRDTVERAMRAAENALKRLRERGNAVPAALLTNLGVLHCRYGLLKGGTDRSAELSLAESLFERALAQLTVENAPGSSQEACSTSAARAAAMLAPGQGITISFNLARLREMQGRVLEAESLYNRIIEAAPTYLDAQLRLAGLAKASGDLVAATKRYEDIIAKAQAIIAGSTSAPGTPGAAGSAVRSAIVSSLVSLGQISEQQGDLKTAKDLYAGALAQPGFDKDPFANISLANMEFQALYSLPQYQSAAAGSVTGGAEATASTNGEKDIVLKAAFLRYKAVIKDYPGNAYAANGLGCVMAEQSVKNDKNRRLVAARDVFTLVREVAPGTMPATLNLAHTLVALDNTDVAAQLYLYAMKKFSGGRGSGSSAAAAASDAAVAGGGAGGAGGPGEQAKLLMMLARSHVLGKRTQDALRAMSRAIALCPTDPRVLFNLSLVQLEDAVKTCAKYLEQLNAFTAASGSGAAPAVPLGERVGPEQLQTAFSYLKAALQGFCTVKSQLSALSAAVFSAEAALAQARASDAPEEEVASLASAVATAQRARKDVGISASALEDVLNQIQANDYVSRAEQLLAVARQEAAKAAVQAAVRAEELARRAAERNKTVEAQKAAEEARKAAENARALALQQALMAKQLQWSTEDAEAATKSRAKKAKSKSKGSDDESGNESDSGGSLGGFIAPAGDKDAEKALEDLFGVDSDAEGGEAEYKPKQEDLDAASSESSTSEDDSSDSGSDSDSSSSGSSSSSSSDDSEAEEGKVKGKGKGKGKGKAKDKAKGKASKGAGTAPKAKKSKHIASSAADTAGSAPSAGAGAGDGDEGDDIFDELFSGETGQAAGKRLRSQREDAEGSDAEGTAAAADTSMPNAKRRAVIDDDDE